MTQENFWGSSFHTPVKNRLYDSYPFGWHGQQNSPDFPTCNSNPYASSPYLRVKARINNQHTCEQEISNTPLNTTGTADYTPITIENFHGHSNGHRGYIRPRAYSRDYPRGYIRPRDLSDQQISNLAFKALIIFTFLFAVLALFHKYKR